MLVLYPYKNALWALRHAKPLGVLSRHPCRNPKPLSPVKGCVCFVGSASCRAFVHTRPASVPGAILLGLPPLDPVGGYAPNPIFKNYIGFSTACSLCKKAEAYINQLLSDKVMLSALFPSVSKITISFLPFFRSGAGIYSFF